MEFHPTAGSIRPGPPAAGDVAQSRLRDSARATGQLQRQRVNIPEVAGGGPSGWTRLAASSVVKNSSGLWFDGWTADPTWDTSPGAHPPAVSVGAGADSVLVSVVQSGWYGVRYNIATDVGGTTLADVQVQGGNDAQGGYDAHMLHVNLPVGSGYRWTGAVSPVWLDAGVGLLAIRMFWAPMGSAPSHTYAAANIDLIRIGY